MGYSFSSLSSIDASLCLLSCTSSFVSDSFLLSTKSDNFNVLKNWGICKYCCLPVAEEIIPFLKTFSGFLFWTFNRWPISPGKNNFLNLEGIDFHILLIWLVTFNIVSNILNFYKCSKTGFWRIANISKKFQLVNINYLEWVVMWMFLFFFTSFLSVPYNVFAFLN